MRIGSMSLMARPAGLPVLKSREFPARINNGPTAIIQIAPWRLPYNTDKAKGASIELLVPDRTTGVEMQVMLTARGKPKHPNAARLMANYVMMEEVNRVFNDDPGGVPMYDTTRLPKDYQPTKPENAARRAEFMKLLGIP